MEEKKIMKKIMLWKKYNGILNFLKLYTRHRSPYFIVGV